MKYWLDNVQMNIGIIASVRHPIREPFAGGLEMHTYLLADRLRARGHEVVVFASSTSDSALGVEPIIAGMDGKGPPKAKVIFSERAREDISMLAEPFMEEHHAYLGLMMRLQQCSFDVVQNNALHYLPVAMASSLPCPCVTTLHTPPTPWLESAVRAQAEPAANLSYVSVSNANAQGWAHTFPSLPVDAADAPAGETATMRHAACSVIPNGVDLERWTYRTAADPGLAVWSGRIVPEKGPHHAVDAAHAAGLRIALAGPVHDRPYFEREVAPRLTGADEHAGHLSHAALSRLIGQAGVFLCTPCWEEPYGLVVAEALACGTPVAAFDRGAMGEILDKRTGRLAEPGCPEALGTAAREALTLSRPDCRRRAECHCSAEIMVDRYEALYEDLVR